MDTIFLDYIFLSFAPSEGYIKYERERYSSYIRYSSYSIIIRKYTNPLKLCYRNISPLLYFMNRPSVLIHSYFRLVKPQFSSFRSYPLLAPKKKVRKTRLHFSRSTAALFAQFQRWKMMVCPLCSFFCCNWYRLTYARGGAKWETEARIPKEERIATCGLDNIGDSASVSYVRITDSDFIELIESIFFVHGMNPS